MQVLRTRSAITFIGACIAIVALGVEAMRRYQGVGVVRPHQFDDGRRADLLLRSGAVVKPPPPRRVASDLVSPPLDEPFEVPIPPFPDEKGKSWAFFPAIGDLDGDGRPDLMVGSRLGRMRFHRGIGTAGRPQFAPPVWFDELCSDGRIPTG